MLARENGGETVLGIVTSCAGIATLFGSLVVTALPAPKNRIRVIYMTMLFSLSIENFVLAFARTPLLWCIGHSSLPAVLAGAEKVRIQRNGMKSLTHRLQQKVTNFALKCYVWLVDISGKQYYHLLIKVAKVGFV